ncbi:UNVERIFIED_CONTAM: hypothetical protein GTU68_061314 [Idotea baltica]|nr:hypothetical protein [Idotea baltica]
MILKPKAFVSHDTVKLARQLLGKFLVKGDEAWLVTEVEAYDGPDDLACHASKGRTARTEVMFGRAGVWYVYLIYGIHEMLNLVTGPEGYPAAILIRGVAGVSGPGRLTKRLKIDRRFNGQTVATSSGLHLEDRGCAFSDDEVEATPRIGVDYAGPDWSQRPYRFVVKREVESAWLDANRV